MEQTVFTNSLPMQYSTPFSRHAERLIKMRDGMGDGMVTRDELKDVLNVLVALCADLNRQTLLSAGLQP